MAKVKLAGKFPGEEQNGFALLEDEWERIEAPNTVLVIARVRRADLNIPADGPRIAKAEVEQIEIVPFAEEAKVLQLMREACHARGGHMAAAPSPTLDGFETVEENESEDDE